jgi:hypothetical protein
LSAGCSGGRIDIALARQHDAVNLTRCPRRHIAVRDILSDEWWLPSQWIAITSPAR